MQSKTGSAFGAYVNTTNTEMNKNNGKKFRYSRLVGFESKNAASIKMLSGTVRLKATVANSDDVKKQPL
jgi:hypothetical protein